MFISKPIAPGKVAGLDGSDVSTDVDNLADDTEQLLLQGQDFGLTGNPDGASASLSAYPGWSAPQGNISADKVSGKGLVHKTGKTTAPMSNPFPAPSSAVRTNPSSIKK